MDEDIQLPSSLGMLVGVAGSIGAAGLLTAVRDSILNANVALVLMVVVVLAAALGGRGAGAVSAAAATVSFDFFHTEPYNSLRMGSDDDIETAVLLLLAGLVVGEITTRARMSRAATEATRSELRRIHRVADLAARGAFQDELVAAARVELTELLTLRDCRYEQPPYAEELERLERSGVVVPPARLVTKKAVGRRGIELPRDGVELPVLHRGEQVGRFRLVPTPGEGASLEERVVAIAIADQVGGAIGSP
jgi:hypothetical protein